MISGTDGGLCLLESQYQPQPWWMKMRQDDVEPMMVPESRVAITSGASRVLGDFKRRPCFEAIL